MTQEDVHNKFLDALTPSDEAERTAPTDEEQGGTVDDTEESDAESHDDADDSESDVSDESEQEQEQPQKYTVKVDGEESEVTLEDLQKGFMMQKDYTRKTEELAKGREELKRASQEAQQQHAKRLQDLNSRVELLDQMAEAMQATVDLEQLRDYDPSEYLKVTENMRKLKDTAEEQRKHIAEQQSAYMEELRANEHERLVAAIPDWLDADAAKAGVQKVREVFTEYSFGDEEISSIFDHRLVRMGHDLALAKAKLAAIESKASQVKQKAAKAAPLSKPQNNVTTGDAERMKKLRGDMRKGKSGAAAEAFKKFL